MKLATLALLAGAPHVVASTSTAPEPPASPKTAIAEYLETCEALGWSGVALVRRKGRVVYHGAHGAADRETGRPLEKDSRFEIASMTKPVAAVALMTLVDAGEVDLDASIAEVLPKVPEHAKAITVRHLLSHRSGMPRSAGGGRGDDLEAAVAGYLSTPPTSTPGTQEEYWNGGFALVAAIVQHVAGRPFEDVVRERVFGPAKMTASGFTGDELPEASQAVGYERGKAPRLATDHPYGTAGWHYRGMGGVVSTAEDLVRFLDATTGGDVVESSTAEEMLTPIGRNHGLGFGVAELPSGGTRYGHGGDVRGFHGYVTATTKDRTEVVVLMNFGPIEAYKIAWNLEALALGRDLPYPPPFERAKWKASELKSLEGTWESATGAVVLETTDAGGLVASAVTSEDPGADVGDDPLALHVAELIRLMDAGDTKGIDERISQKYPGWETRLVEDVWRPHVEKHGALVDVTPFAVIPSGRGSTDVRFRLRHERGRVLGYATLVDGLVAGLFVDETESVFLASKGYVDPWAQAAVRTWWLPTDAQELVRIDWAKQTVAERMRLDRRPKKAKSLTIGSKRYARD